MGRGTNELLGGEGMARGGAPRGPPEASGGHQVHGYVPGYHFRGGHTKKNKHSLAAGPSETDGDEADGGGAARSPW